MNNTYLTALSPYLISIIFVFSPFALANETNFSDPFVPKTTMQNSAHQTLAVSQKSASGEVTESSTMSCQTEKALLMSDWPLEQLKLIGLFSNHEKQILWWLTPTQSVVSSELNDVIAQEQWQVSAIESQAVTLQSCHTQQPIRKNIHL